MRQLGSILRYFRGEQRKIAAYFITNLLAVVFSIFSLGMLAPVLQVLFRDSGDLIVAEKGQPLSYITAYVQNMMHEQSKITVLTYVCIAVVCFTLLKNLFLYLSAYLLNPIRNTVLMKLRDDLYRKTLSLPIGFFTEERKGDLMSRMTNDIHEVELSIMATLQVLIREPLTILCTMAVMISISPQLTLFLLLFLPVAGLIIGRIGKSLRRTSSSIQQQLSLLLGTIEETISGMRVIKAFGAEKQLHDRFRGINNLLFRTRNRQAARSEAASPVSESLGVIAVSVILWYGGSLIFSNQTYLQPEQFILYIVLFTQIINPFKNLSTSFFNIQKGSAALERISQLLLRENSITEKPDAQAVSGLESDISFHNVSFRYGDKTILDNISFRIPKGKTIALVGASGAGKSTLADLIPRFHDVTEGSITIDGADLRDLQLGSLRGLIGVVSQDPMLFNDTIYNNIALGSGDPGEARVRAAAEVAHADLFIRQKPDGYHTLAGDRGSKLSGGERQRVTIARAILKNPPILILDEATSSLDTESERIVQDAINKLMEHRTCLVIAHRLSTVRHADEILVMEKGKIVQRGRHDTLLEEEGLYRKLVAMQEVK